VRDRERHYDAEGSRVTVVSAARNRSPTWRVFPTSASNGERERRGRGAAACEASRNAAVWSRIACRSHCAATSRRSCAMATACARADGGTSC